jgi:methylamine utilization protein MauE
MNESAAAARVVVGIVFLAAALGKALHGDRFEFALQLEGIVRPTWVRRVRWTLPVIEASVGVLVLAPIQPALGVAAAATLLVVFTAAVWPAVRSGQRLPCGCFGITSSSVDQSLMVRNAILLLLCLLALLSPANLFEHWPWTSSRDIRQLTLIALLVCLPAALGRAVALWREARSLAAR